MAPSSFGAAVIEAVDTISKGLRKIGNRSSSTDALHSESTTDVPCHSCRQRRIERDAMAGSCSAG